MGFGDFGGWNSWTPRDHALNKMVYDEAHKKGGGNGRGSSNNTGCALWFLIIIIGVIIIILFGNIFHLNLLNPSK